VEILCLRFGGSGVHCLGICLLVDVDDCRLEVIVFFRRVFTAVELMSIRLF